MPEFSGTVKPLGARMVPAVQASELSSILAELKTEVDDLANE